MPTRPTSPVRSPSSFFAPAQIAKRSEAWGPADLDARIGRSLAEFLDPARQWLTVQYSSGPDEVTAVHLDLLEGRLGQLERRGRVGDAPCEPP